MTIRYVTINGLLYIKTTPQWLKGTRPVSTYRPV